MSNPTADFITERKPSPSSPLPSRQPPKSILKKRPPTTTTTTTTAAASTSPTESPSIISFKNSSGSPTNDDNNEEPEPITGLTPSQASRILELAKTELIKPAVPLSVFEFLCTLPLSPSSTSSSPTPADSALFLSHISAFTPAEYLDLVEERNCLDKCGYTLCANKRRNIPGEFKIHRNGVAKTADLNKWCSDECALRALYIKVQLDNPSYVRRGGEMVVKVELREEKKKTTTNTKTASTPPPAAATKEGEKGKKKENEDEHQDKLAKDMAKLDLNPNSNRGKTEEELLQETLEEKILNLKLSDQKKARQALGALAIERNRMSGNKVEVNIQEKETTQVAQPPSATKSADAHLMIEGYNSASRGEKPEHDEDGSDDSDDDDPFPTVRLEVINMGKS